MEEQEEDWERWYDGKEALEKLRGKNGNEDSDPDCEWSGSGYDYGCDG